MGDINFKKKIEDNFYVLSFTIFSILSKAMLMLSVELAKEKDRFLLVFDGRGAMNLIKSEESIGQFTLLFTDKTESADDYIARKVANIEPSSAVVVSSDKEVIRAAKAQRVKVMASETFLRTYQFVQAEEREKPQAPNEKDLDFWMEQFSQ